MVGFRSRRRPKQRRGVSGPLGGVVFGYVCLDSRGRSGAHIPVPARSAKQIIIPEFVDSAQGLPKLADVGQLLAGVGQMWSICFEAHQNLSMFAKFRSMFTKFWLRHKLADDCQIRAQPAFRSSFAKFGRCWPKFVKVWPTSTKIWTNSAKLVKSGTNPNSRSNCSTNCRPAATAKTTNYWSAAFA